MNDQSYRTTLVVQTTPDQAFEAINDVRGWWSQDVDGRTDTVGAEFAYRGNQDGVNVHRARIRVTELVPGQRVVWHVLDNWMSFIDDQSEWKGTEIRFELSARDGGTQVRFTHVGLTPAYECFDVCRDAWGTYVNESLRRLIETGVGQPTLKPEEGDDPRFADLRRELAGARS